MAKAAKDAKEFFCWGCRWVAQTRRGRDCCHFASPQAQELRHPASSEYSAVGSPALRERRPRPGAMVRQSRRAGLRLCKLFAWKSRKIKGRILRYLLPVAVEADTEKPAARERRRGHLPSMDRLG
jgi:hypothetical protein